jgi:hypothetical protein
VKRTVGTLWQKMFAETPLNYQTIKIFCLFYWDNISCSSNSVSWIEEKTLCRVILQDVPTFLPFWSSLSTIWLKPKFVLLRRTSLKTIIFRKIYYWEFLQIKTHKWFMSDTCILNQPKLTFSFFIIITSVGPTESIYNSFWQPPFPPESVQV